MSYTVTKSGPYFSSGEIKFSDLRTYFKETTSGTIKATELLRNTATNTIPIVPDCSENRVCGVLANGISTLNDLKISQFRNSIKYYNITQTGTNDNASSTATIPGCNINTLTWNNNLQYNIVKQFNINGTIGSFNSSQYATLLNSTTYNLFINVSGSVLGGPGLGSSSITSRNGSTGGGALYINPGTNGTVYVSINSTGSIYGGGGGGAMGNTGANGTAGTCVDSYTTTGCGFCPGCASPYVRTATAGGACCAGFCGSPCWSCCFNCTASNCTSTCTWTRTVAGAPGGRGGYGGRGIGYGFSSQTGSLGPNFGETGGPVYGGCPTYGPRTAGDGLRGQTGGNGATTWGGTGGSTTGASGGSPGRGIAGINYTVFDTGYTSNIKGGY